MKKIVSFCVLTFMLFSASANNIQITNITVSGQNISFNLSWENSWNTMSNINPLYPNNWDGTWVFVKYQNNIDNLWKHATLSSTGGDHSITGGVLEINTVADGMGVFIRRTNPGFGNISATAVTLRMNALVGAGAFNFKVFGTEVVYIPQSAFQIGDGNVSGASYFTAQDIDAVKQGAGFSAGALFSGSPILPSAFPMGFNAYYMMKYEISNEQWVDFLNTLNYDQQANRIDVVPNSVVNTQAYVPNGNSIVDNVIKIQAPGLNNTLPATFGCDLNGNNTYNESADGQNMAAAFLSKADFYALMDWSGLRPMTEMEFEKACRGTLPRVAGEYAWGSTTINARTRTQYSNLGTANEAWTGVIANGQATAVNNVNGSYGPSRVGVFATNSSGRATSGAGFYGNMELTGNVWEFAVCVDAAGALFNAVNGNGTLTTSGDADVLNWPGNYTGAVGFGTTIRGGSWVEVTSYTYYLSVSGRNSGTAGARSYNLGGRGVRTAP